MRAYQRYARTTTTILSPHTPDTDLMDRQQHTLAATQAQNILREYPGPAHRGQLVTPRPCLRPTPRPRVTSARTGRTYRPQETVTGRDLTTSDERCAQQPAERCSMQSAGSPRTPSVAARTCDGQTHTRSDCEALRGHARTHGRERGRAGHRRARAHLVGLMPALLHAGRVGVRGERTAANWPARGRTRAHGRSVCEALTTARSCPLHAVNVSVRALGMRATMAPGLCEVRGQCAEGGAPSVAIARDFKVDCCSCDACGTQGLSTIPSGAWAVWPVG